MHSLSSPLVKAGESEYSDSSERMHTAPGVPQQCEACICLLPFQDTMGKAVRAKVLNASAKSRL
eukprot:6474931-Amphidinium_carterae.1